ncbi:uncharacterized protein TNCV_4198261 [Trichonephila clavipes]|nr:uncharacterized protein TNCV_4198261 [Trichonephila clavipes]
MRTLLRAQRNLHILVMRKFGKWNIVEISFSSFDYGSKLRSASSTTRGLLATDHVILNHGQVTWTTPELAPPLLTTTPHQREDVSALDRFNVHRCPTRRVFSGTGFEPVTKQATVRYLYHSATTATIVSVEPDTNQRPMDIRHETPTVQRSTN